MIRALFHTLTTSAVDASAPTAQMAMALRADLGMPKVQARLTANPDALAARCDAR